ncbi:MAG: MinD/ParA family ATP-binding protein [Candidatus Hodarchaeales archaeon]
MSNTPLKSLTIMSHKGGVGKTSISVNLAVYLAKTGKNVCLLENDFQAPSLNTWWRPKVKWLNDYLLENASIEDCLQNLSPRLNLPGKLLVGFADPTPDSIQRNIRMDQEDSMKMLQNLVRAKTMLNEDPYEVEYLINDCPPGIGYSAVNAMIATDSTLFIVKLSNADIIGTSLVIKGLYKRLKRRTLVLANLIPKEVVNDEKKKTLAQDLVEKTLIEPVGDSSHVFQFIGWIPTDDTLISLEFEQALKTLSGEESSRIIYTLDQPEHIFSTTLIDLIPLLFGES